MSRFKIFSTPIDELKIIERQELCDSRGSLSRLFCAEEIAAAGWLTTVSQINHSVTHKLGTVRGMHYQLPPHNETKLVACLKGSVWDVAVDLRFESPTFLKWHALELSASNHLSLLIPNGFAHGFQALSDECELIYLHSCAYAAGFEAGINPIDPLLAIKWPLLITQLSDKDKKFPLLDHHFKGLDL